MLPIPMLGKIKKNVVKKSVDTYLLSLLGRSIVNDTNVVDDKKGVNKEIIKRSIIRIKVY